MEQAIKLSEIEELQELVIDQLDWWGRFMERASDEGNGEVFLLSERAYELAFFSLMALQAATAVCTKDPQTSLRMVFNAVDDAELKFGKDAGIASRVRDGAFQLMSNLKTSDTEGMKEGTRNMFELIHDLGQKTSAITTKVIEMQPRCLAGMTTSKEAK